MDTTSTYELESGKIKVRTYTREDLTSGKRIRGVIKDIYTNLENFNESIIWIDDVTPAKDKTITDVLDEYTEKYGEEAFVMCQAGCVTSDKPAGLIEEHTTFISTMVSFVLEAYFYRVLFNRCMSHSYGVPDFCIYSNDKTEDWIKDNMGEGKIIKSVMSSSKIS